MITPLRRAGPRRRPGGRRQRPWSPPSRCRWGSGCRPRGGSLWPRRPGGAGLPRRPGRGGRGSCRRGRDRRVARGVGGEGRRREEDVEGRVGGDGPGRPVGVLGVPAADEGVGDGDARQRQGAGPPSGSRPSRTIRSRAISIQSPPGVTVPGPPAQNSAAAACSGVRRATAVLDRRQLRRARRAPRRSAAAIGRASSPLGRDPGFQVPASGSSGGSTKAGGVGCQTPSPVGWCCRPRPRRSRRRGAGDGELPRPRRRGQSGRSRGMGTRDVFDQGGVRRGRLVREAFGEDGCRRAGDGGMRCRGAFATKGRFGICRRHDRIVGCRMEQRHGATSPHGVRLVGDDRSRARSVQRKSAAASSPADVIGVAVTGVDGRTASELGGRDAETDRHQPGRIGRLMDRAVCTAKNVKKDAVMGMRRGFERV